MLVFVVKFQLHIFLYAGNICLYVSVDDNNYFTFNVVSVVFLSVYFYFIYNRRGHYVRAG